MGVRAINSENGGVDDSTVVDTDDILMLTVRSYGEPFVGRLPILGSSSWPSWEGGQSQVAEVCWFMRGNTLYRRVLLVAPERPVPMHDRAERFFARLANAILCQLEQLEPSAAPVQLPAARIATV